MQVLNPASISVATVSTVNKVVQEKAEYKIEFKTPVPLSIGCVIDIKFPPEIQLNSADLTNVRGLSLFGASRTLNGTISKILLSLLISDTQTNTFTITDGCDEYKTTDLSAISYFSTVRNP
jgi:hypothetical protein